MHDDNTIDMPAGISFTGRAVSYFVRWLIERNALPQLDAVITNSEYMFTRISRKYRRPNHLYWLYYQAHDYRRIRYADHSIDPAKPIHILFVKNDFVRGGLGDLLLALERIPDLTFKVSVVGPTRKQVRRKIPGRLLEQAHVTVQIVGQVHSWTRMEVLYHSHDLLCVPSKREALGLANAEALACGTPVVTTTAGGIPEVMNGNANGYLSEPGDFIALARNLRKCVTEHAETRDKSRAGRDFVLQRFDVESMFNRLEQIFINHVKLPTHS
jgi:glycosyltransferase involved in cell wall biosynthesis